MTGGIIILLVALVLVGIWLCYLHVSDKTSSNFMAAAVTKAQERLDALSELSERRKTHLEPDFETELEDICETLQSILDGSRQVVTSATAADARLASSLRKSLHQAKIWQDRAIAAVQHSNDELAKQALQHRAICLSVAEDIELELSAHRSVSSAFEEQLLSMEKRLQKAQVRKKLLIARFKTASAVLKADQILFGSSSDEDHSLFELFEWKVEARERKSTTNKRSVNGSYQERLDEFDELYLELDKIERFISRLEQRLPTRNKKQVKADNDVEESLRKLKEEQRDKNVDEETPDQPNS